MHIKAATMVSLLGKKVEGVTAEGESALIIGFSDNETLSIIIDDAPYERFTINSPLGLIVV
jgi:hypothetical protein